jgi:hypothetical protein
MRRTSTISNHENQENPHNNNYGAQSVAGGHFLMKQSETS